jgi:hypothetical protein
VIFDHDVIDTSTINVKWQPLESPNGPSPKYLLSTSIGGIDRNYTADGNSRRVKIDCSNHDERTLNLSMLAYNKPDGVELAGPSSKIQIKNLCGETIGTAIIDLSVECKLVDGCLCERVNGKDTTC